MTELADRFVRYLQAFACGKGKAQTAATICAALDLPQTEQGKREIRACAQIAIKAGHLVCSGQSGYWIPATPAEVLAATSRWRAEAYELIRRAKRADELSAERFDLREAPEVVERPALLMLMEAS